MPIFCTSILFLSAILALYPLICVWTLCEKLFGLFTAPSLELAWQLSFVEIPILFVTLSAIWALEMYVKHICTRWPWMSYAAAGVSLTGVLLVDLSFVARHQEDISEAVHVNLVWLSFMMEGFFHQLRMYLQNKRAAPDFYQVTRCLVDTLNNGTVI